MSTIRIRREKNSTRCEICHQSDLFDPVKEHCSRCNELPNLRPETQETVQRWVPRFGVALEDSIRPQLAIAAGVFLFLLTFGGGGLFLFSRPGTPNVSTNTSFGSGPVSPPAPAPVSPPSTPVPPRDPKLPFIKFGQDGEISEIGNLNRTEEVRGRPSPVRGMIISQRINSGRVLGLQILEASGERSYVILSDEDWETFESIDRQLVIDSIKPGRMVTLKIIENGGMGSFLYATKIFIGKLETQRYEALVKRERRVLPASRYPTDTSSCSVMPECEQFESGFHISNMSCRQIYGGKPYIIEGTVRNQLFDQTGEYQIGFSIKTQEGRVVDIFIDPNVFTSISRADSGNLHYWTNRGKALRVEYIIERGWGNLAVQIETVKLTEEFATEER